MGFPDDNPGFRGDPGIALAELLIRRLRWPAEERPGTGAALHAKIVVIDDVTALITSANLTKRAAGDNLEVGVLIGEETFRNVWPGMSPSCGSNAFYDTSDGRLRLSCEAAI